jgi:type IV fimbrial biogenesis protein FimT
MHTHHGSSAYVISSVTGFTAIELMVTLAVLAVLAALAAPSFKPLVERWRVRSAVEQLESTLRYAHSEAIKRGGHIAIQKIPNNTNGCTIAPNLTDWGCGWYVCEDTNNNGKCTSAEPVLQRIEAPTGVEVTRTGGGANIKINRWGLVDGAYLGFNLTPANETVSNPAAQGLCMSSGGRIQVISFEKIPCTG